LEGRLAGNGVGVRLSNGYECTPAVEKGIYHGSRAWAMTIIPLHSEADLPATKVAEIQAGLSGLR